MRKKCTRQWTVAVPNWLLPVLPTIGGAASTSGQGGKGLLLPAGLLLYLVLAVGNVLAVPNATIVNGDVQLRESYPSFGMSTLLRFELVAGPILTVIPEGSRVEVTEKKLVANTQEWFKTAYEAGARRFDGWVFAGEQGDRRYVRLDPGVEQRLPVAARGEEVAPSRSFASTTHLLDIPAAAAQPVSLGVPPPPVPTNPFLTLLLSCSYVVIYIVSIFTTKKLIFPQSNVYTFLTSLSVLLILGFLSQTTFSDLIATLITNS